MTLAARPWRTGLAAGIAAGVLAVPFAAHLHSGDAAPGTGRPGDRVQHAVDGLRRDHFYVGPELRDRLTDAQFSAIADAATRAATPTYVVWWDDVGGDGGYAGDYVAVDQIMAALDEEGYYAVVTNGSSSVALDAVGLAPPRVDGSLAQGRPDVALLRFVTALGAAPREDGYGDDSDHWGEAVGGLTAGAFIAVPSFLLLLLLVRLAALFRRSR